MIEPIESFHDGHDLVEIFDCDQGEDDWWSLRIGALTASNFSSVMAEGEGLTRKGLLFRLAGERLSGVPAESYENDAMRRGRAHEPLSLADYALTRGVEVRRVGFVRRTVASIGDDFTVGCSPDGLVDPDGGVESKSVKPELIVAMMESGAKFPSQFRAQVQGNIWVLGRPWFDLKISYEKMPISLTFRVERDDAYIKQLSNVCEIFLHDLDQLVKRLKRKGGVR